jgi:phage gp36-like protein
MADYATRAQLADLGVSNEALTDIPDAKQDAVIAARSRFADGYLRVRQEVPEAGLTAFTGDLTWAVCQLSCYDLVSNLGYETGTGNQDNLRKRHDDAIKWLEAVRDGDLPFPGSGDDSASDAGEVLMHSSRPRGWTHRGRWA